MHTRRFGAFITGMWLMGAIFMWFAQYQAGMNVDRLFSNPPQVIQKELNDMGSDVARQVFRYDTNLLMRRVRENWEVIQLGLLGALVVTSILTAHRSRVVIACSVLMMIFVLVQAFYLTPLMTGLERSFDFVAATAAARERDAYAGFQRWHSTLSVANVVMAMLISSRLLFDFYDFGSVVLPWSRPTKKRRRIRRSGSAASRPAAAGVDAPAAEPQTEAE
jgi:hypothetical protein